MRKFILILFCCIFIISDFNLKVWAQSSPPEVSADSVVLMDGLTGQVLYSKNPDNAYPPASTKTMTALLTLENANLDDKVTIGKNPPFADGSKAGIMESEVLTVRDLLYGLLFVSGNDCAEALAEHVGGSIDKFVEMMNNRAKELGCTNTHFVNPSGLYDPNHKTSAKDLALIMRELVKHPEYSEIASDNVPYYITPSNNPGMVHPVSNEIQMVWKNGRNYYEGIEGAKTGYTIQSLFSYVVSAKRNDRRLIVAMVHSPVKSYYSESARLLDYGFENFELKKLYSKGDKVADYKIKNKVIPLIAEDDIYYSRKKDSSDTAKVAVDNNMDLSNKSFKKGDNVMEADITFNGQVIGTVKLASGVDYSFSKVFTANKNAKRNPFSVIFKFLVGLFAAFFVIILLLRFIIRTQRRKYKRNFNRKRYFSHYR